MRAHLLPRPLFRRTSLVVLSVLACVALTQNTAFAQLRNNLQPASPVSRSLHLQISGNGAHPLSMVSGDFDEDGVADLVIGYGLDEGGSIALLRGNRDAIAPQSQASWLAAGRHEDADPFLQPSKTVSLKTAPSLMASADVNGDGHLDVVYATKGSGQLQVMLGTGHGTFLPQTVSITVPGGITALASYRPGAPVLGEALLVGYQSRGGAKLGILSYGTTGLSMSASYALPAAPTALLTANLDADLVPDTAIVAGGELLVLHGQNAINGGGHLDVLPVDGAEAVTSGEFLFDRHAQTQLSVVTTSGDVLILAHQGFDPRPYTPQQIAGTRSRQRTPSLAQLAGNTGNEPWTVIETHAGAGAHNGGSDVPILLRSRMSGSGGDDLIVVNPSQQQRVVISHSAVASPASIASSSPTEVAAVSPVQSNVAVSNLASDSVVAALPARVSSDGRPGVVTLKANDISPEITLPSAGNTFYVNTTSDNTGTNTDPSDGTRCTQGSGEVCTLRDAVTFINNDATLNINGNKSDTIMVPAGTYALTWQRGTFNGDGNALSHLEILGPVTIIGSTTGGGVTIDAQNNDKVFSINPGPFGTENPSGNSYLFDTTLENLVMKNGRNNNNINTSVTGAANYVGGGIDWDAFGTGNLTITNSTIENCVALWGPGGGIWTQNSAGGGTGTLTLSGDTISDNSTAEQGGAVYGAFPAAAMSATNTVFSSNIAEPSVNSSDPGAEGSAGGLFITNREATPATPQTTLTGVSITSNSTTVDGGGIFTNSGILLTGSLVNKNSAGRWGGGVFTEVASPEVGTTITSTNLLQNSATTAGGAILEGPETASAGNALQVSLSRIFGNTSSGGASGLANGDPAGGGAGSATATNNWWGCNAGPSTSGDGCDRAILYDASTGSMSVAPYAQFALSATNSTSVTLGGSLDLSITLNKNSSSATISGAFPAVATNYPYTFAVTGVTASPALTSGTFTTAGTGTATLTPSTAGNGTVSATFDSQTASVNFTSTAASTSLAISPASPAFQYGSIPTITVQFNPSGATGITASNFTVTVDNSTTLGSSSFGLVLLSNNLYQITGPFNLISPGGHTLKVTFAATGDYSGSSMTAGLTVAQGTATIGDTLTPTNPVQGQGGTVNVTVAPTGTGATPTGSLTYAFDGGSAASVGLTGGAAGISIPTIITAGSHSLAISYGGDANYAGTSTTVPITIFGRSQTTIASLTATTATINVVGLGFTPPSGQLAFTDTTSGNPVAAPVTLNTATATPALLPQVTTSTGVNSLPVWTSLGDVNGDGKNDLVTSVFGTDSVNVQLGNGDGTFGAATSILIVPGFGPAESHLVSLRGNGTLDLIVASFNTNQIAVLLGNGNGTFQPPVLYTSGTVSNTPTSLTTGDFNHDGNLDVAVANTGDNTISVFVGNGSGSLTPDGSPISVGHDPEAVRAGDFNGDGYSDLAVANYSDGTVTTLLNNQNGTFTPTVVPVGSGAHSGPQALAINGTGSGLKLAVANYTDNTVSVLPSNGDGSFGTQKIVNVGRGPDDVTFADFNNDGIEDLAVSNYTDGTVDLLLGSGSGNYTLTGPFAVGNNPYSAAVADIDLDGTPDVVVPNCFSNNTGVLLSGTQISVPYSGLGLVPGDTLHATYTPDGASKYGSSVSAGVTAP